MKCPYCGSGNVEDVTADWIARSIQDEFNIANISEWQCKDENGRSFWVTQ